jgi:hypothetical protein
MWSECRDCRLWSTFNSRWTYDGKNSLEFEHAAAVMHRSSPWMLGEEEGLSRDITDHSSGWQSDGCGQAVRSGGGSDLSSGENEFLHKRNPKECEKWMWWWIVRLLVPFIGWREGRRCCGGETIDSEWSFLMLPFQGEERKGQRPVSKGERSTHGGSWFPCGEATRGCSSAAVTGIWFDPRWKTTNRANWGERLFGTDTIVKIKHATEMEWAGKVIFFGQRKIMEKIWTVVV